MEFEAAERYYNRQLPGLGKRLHEEMRAVSRYAELRKLAALASPAPAKRPDKKFRRLIHRFKQGL